MRPTADSPNLDLLRSLAVTYVVVFHLLAFFWKTRNLGILTAIGHWGVLLFFVHTSLVLMFSLQRQEARSPKAHIFAPFYVRRCFRILPLSILVVTVVAIFGWPVGWLSGGRFYAVHLSAAGFISNLLLLQNLTRTHSIIVPLWSLPYEMQMYFIFPALYLFVRSIRNVRPIAGLWLTTALMAYAALKLFHAPYPSFLALAPCFMAGIVTYKLGELSATELPFIGWPMMIVLATYLYWRQNTVHHNWAWSLMVLLPLIPALGAGVLRRKPSELSRVKLPFIGWPIMIFLTTYLYLRFPMPQRGWILCLVVGASLPYFSEMGQNWLRKVCHGIARYSYGIYLVHFICIWLAFVKLAELPFAVRWLAFLVTVAGIPVILYHLVEAPMISLGRRIADRVARRAEIAPQLILVPAASLNSVDGEVPVNFPG
jgi:peptidoglycan/LPS O-acetylase OafA/YrhL